ncbi:hypothetical protein ACFLT5_02750 [Chloroflexota bacterium]
MPKPELFGIIQKQIPSEECRGILEEEIALMPFEPSEEGQTSIEYALILVLIVIVVILFILVVWPAIEGILPEIDLFRSITGTPTPP